MEGRTGKLKEEEYNQIINDSMDATIKMSIYSSITTLIPIIILLIMGSHEIFTFIFAMFIGLIAGTFSSIFVAPTVWKWLRLHSKPKAKKKKTEKKEALDEYTIKGINA